VREVSKDLCDFCEGAPDVLARPEAVRARNGFMWRTMSASSSVNMCSMSATSSSHIGGPSRTGLEYVRASAMCPYETLDLSAVPVIA